MKKKLIKILFMTVVLFVSPAAAISGNTVYAAENDYILPDSDSRAYTYEELSGLSKADIRLAINEIYARHGYAFNENGITEGSVRPLA